MWIVYSIGKLYALLNQVWIAYSKFVKFYAYWIRYELFTVLSSLYAC